MTVIFASRVILVVSLVIIVATLAVRAVIIQFLLISTIILI